MRKWVGRPRSSAASEQSRAPRARPVCWGVVGLTSAPHILGHDEQFHFLPPNLTLQLGLASSSLRHYSQCGPGTLRVQEPRGLRGGEEK